MRYITIVIVIVFYFFILSLGIDLLLKDEFISSQDMEGNTSFKLVNTTDVDMSITDLPEKTTLRTFIDILKIMFGFRTPIPQGIPTILVVILSFTNWFLIVLLGISLYRIVNPLA